MPAARAAWTGAPGTAGDRGLRARKQARPNQETFHAFQVAELSIELIEVLAPLMPRIKQRDKSLADQLSRAASGTALNLGDAT